MAFQNPGDDRIRELLEGSKNIAVVGMKDDPAKPVYFVSEYMQNQGYNILPVNPDFEGKEILGKKVVGSLDDLEEPIDIVNVFRRSHEVAGVVDQAIQAGAKAVWTQAGIEDEEAGRKAEETGMVVVMDKCIKVEHGSLVKR